MAMNLTPTHWLPGYSATASAISIPLSALPGLDASEADASTGDIRKIARALSAALYAAYIGEDAADRPSRMVLSRSTYVDDSANTMRRTYTARFDVQAGEEEVAAEPEAQEG